MSSDFKKIRDEILELSQTLETHHKEKPLLDSLTLAMFNLCIIAEHVEEGKPFQQDDKQLLENSFDSIIRAAAQRKK